MIAVAFPQDEPVTEPAIDRSLRRVVLAVALLNLGYFGVEFAVALAIGSVSLFADSIDFLEDTLGQPADLLRDGVVGGAAARASAWRWR